MLKQLYSKLLLGIVLDGVSQLPPYFVFKLQFGSNLPAINNTKIKEPKHVIQSSMDSIAFWSIWFSKREISGDFWSLVAQNNQKFKDIKCGIKYLLHYSWCD